MTDNADAIAKALYQGVLAEVDDLATWLEEARQASWLWVSMDAPDNLADPSVMQAVLVLLRAAVVLWADEVGEDVPDEWRDSTATVERLAHVQHAIWAHWMSYQFGLSITQADGTEILPAVLVNRWRRQMKTVYEDLPEGERESDRRQAHKVMRALGLPVPGEGKVNDGE